MQVERLEDGATKNAPLPELVNAMTWAESIDNDWMRTRMVQRVAGS